MTSVKIDSQKEKITLPVARQQTGKVFQNTLDQYSTIGRWDYIHPALGIPREWMTKTGKPCLMCNGHDRSIYDDKDGRGTYHCRGCGAGDGFTLLMKYHGWDFKRTADEIRKVLGLTGDKRTAIEIPKSVKKITENEPPKTYSYAIRLWENAENGSVSSHQYAINKFIKHDAGAARGIASGKLIGKDVDCLIIPMRTLDGELTGVECINATGVKQTFGGKGILILGNDLDSTLPQLVVEGWATAVAILKMYGWNACVYACFGKGMLDRLAMDIAIKYPKRQIIIVGECDA